MATEVSSGWRQALAAWLARHKSYPDTARRNGIEGVVQVRFSLDRTGLVTDVALARGSGSPILDEATLAMLRDARVPAPPADTPGERMTVSVQIRYTLAN